ncbi:patatin-like phospholipase family protein [Spirochaetota bacterium]
MKGLVLEGGGAKGSYHMGVVKALFENGYDFDAYVGTSIGAINAAVLAQGDFELAMELWENISMDQLFDEEEQYLLQLIKPDEVRINADFPANIKRALAKIISGRGINTDKIRSYLEKYLDEDKIRSSGKDFGLVTVSLTERKALELMLEDIPRGQLVSYIMASASVPGLRPQKINEKIYLDGGLYNNVPVNLLYKKGYDDIIVIRTHAPGLVRNLDDYPNIKTISSTENLGSMFLFTKENCQANLKLGYFDGLRFARKLPGKHYYIQPLDRDKLSMRLMAVDGKKIAEAAKLLGIGEYPPQRMLFEKVIPKLAPHLDLPEKYDYADFAIALVEDMAIRNGIERFALYDFKKLCSLAKKSKPIPKEESLAEKLAENHWVFKRKLAVELLAKAMLGICS